MKKILLKLLLCLKEKIFYAYYFTNILLSRFIWQIWPLIILHLCFQPSDNTFSEVRRFTYYNTLSSTFRCSHLQREAHDVLNVVRCAIKTAATSNIFPTARYIWIHMSNWHNSSCGAFHTQTLLKLSIELF